MNNTSIILVAPQMGENIGAAARVMKNFGLSDLRIVAPRDGWPNPLALDMASGAAEIVEQAKLFATLEEAVADLSYIYAVTARPRDMVKPVVILSERSESKDLKFRAAAGDPSTTGVPPSAQDDKTGFVFGPERTGLTNPQVVLADAILTIPANPDFSSLNLAQSVAVVCYEISTTPPLRGSTRGKSRAVGGEPSPVYGRGQGEGMTPHDSAFASGLASSAPPQGGSANTPATKKELIGLLEHLESHLDRLDAYANVETKKPVMVANLRNMFTRAGLTSQEVQTFRGVIRILTGTKQ